MSVPGLVSVVIPTYNRAHTIERAVDSVLAQDYPSVEVIVVDDGSTDGTAARMLRYKSDARVRFLRFPNGGVCVARNRGLREVRGEFVAMLDSDDYWLPGKLSLQVQVLETNSDLSLVWTDMDAVDSSGRVVSKNHLRKMYSCYRYFPDPLELFEDQKETEDGTIYYVGHIATALVFGNLVHTSTVVARADRVSRAGEYDQSLHPAEDQDFYYRVCKTGSSSLIDAVTVHYQVGAADAATADSRFYELATSAHKVFERLRNREGPSLSPERVKLAERDLYAWVGKAAYYHGDMRLSRQYLFRGLMRGCTDARSLAYLLLACIPGYRFFRRRVGAKETG